MRKQQKDNVVNFELDTLEERVLMSADPMISEFMASNSGGLETTVSGEVKSPDWIEIHNTDDSVLNLQGWYLTDDAENLTKWAVPSFEVGANGYGVIFASGLNIVDDLGSLHTNFSLSSNGEYLALVKPDGITVVSEFATGGEDYPDQRSGVSYGIGQANGFDTGLTLTVDPLTGQIAIQNYSLDTITLKGYTINSAGGNLNVAGWNSLDDQGLALWDEANPTSTSLSEFEIINGIALSPGQVYHLGDAVNTVALGDLSLDYVIAEDDLARAASVLMGTLPVNEPGDWVANHLPEFNQSLFFLIPTPGAINNDGIVDFLGKVNIGVGRGFYDVAFDTSITSTEPGASIIYTTDGTKPSASNGVQVNAAGVNDLLSINVTITGTTVLRAMTYKRGYVSDVTTNSYVFVQDVIDSSVMDSNVTNDPRYAADMKRALEDIPSISISFSGATAQGQDDIETSVEWLTVDGLPGFQIDAGIQEFGGYFTNFAKKNFRLTFNGDFGEKDLKYPLFEGFEHGVDPVEIFRQLDLRTGSHDMSQRGFYMSNRFTDDVLLELGHTVPHGRFVHVYKNGVYWGQYHLRERFDANMVASYEGADNDKYEAVNGNNNNVGGQWAVGVAYDGDGSGWEHIKSLSGDYEEIKKHLDIVNYVDFLLLYMSGNSENEYRTAGALDESDPFSMYLNDADGFLRGVGDRTGDPGPGNIMRDLLNEGHPEFLQLVSDRIHFMFFDGGVLSVESNVVRLQERVDEIKYSFIAESARWGYRSYDSWESSANNILNNHFQSLTETMINRFKARGLYSNVVAPTFDQQGGQVDIGTLLNISSGAGATYYTTDGTDPRAYGTASSVDTLLSGGAAIKAYVPTIVDAGLGLAWTQPSFNDNAWNSGSGGVGYENGSGYEGHFGLDVKEDMFGKNASVYIRSTFNVGDTSSYTTLTLKMKYDDGFIAYLNGTKIVITDNAQTAEGDWSGRATQSHNDNAAVSFSKFDISEYIHLLVDGENVLAIHGVNSGDGSSDMLIVPEIEASDTVGVVGENALLYEGAVALNQSMEVKARTLSDNGQWSALKTASFLVGNSSLLVTEVNYNPHAAITALGELDVDNDEFEFVEIMNNGAVSQGLNGVQLIIGNPLEANSIFTFGGGITLAAGERLVVVKNRAAFESRYGEDIKIAGEYTTKLGNGGDTILLRDLVGTQIVSFEYNDSSSWPGRADGDGSSLELVDLGALNASLSEGDFWESSLAFAGTPGEARLETKAKIVINEVVTHTDMPKRDQVEIYNYGNTTLDISGWYLSDSNGNYLKYQFENGVSIDVGEYFVIDETDFNAVDAGNPSSAAFGLSGARGDDLWLIGVDENGKPSVFVDHVKFGAAFNINLAEGTSLGRLPGDTTGERLVHLADDTIGSANTGHRVSDVIISEINYNSTLDDGVPDTLEFIEIFNQSDATINIGGWRLDNAVKYEFSAGTMIDAKGIIVIVGFAVTDTALLNAFKSAYSVGEDVTILGPYTGSLNNSGERVQLERPDSPPAEEPLYTPYIVQDEVNYDNNNGWAISADGNGDSLQRISGDAYGNNENSWIGMTPTPGKSSLVVVEGDYDGDGEVDTDDLNVVKQGFGSSFTLTDLFAVRNNMQTLSAAAVIPDSGESNEPVVAMLTEENVEDEAGVVVIEITESVNQTSEAAESSIGLSEPEVLAETDNANQIASRDDSVMVLRDRTQTYQSLYDLLDEDPEELWMI